MCHPPFPGPNWLVLATQTGRVSRSLTIQFVVVIAYPSLISLSLNSRDASQLSAGAILPGCTDITPDADIAGIGVRISTYIQSLLILFPTFIFVSDGFVDSHEESVLNKSYTNQLLTACALIFSAIIQAATVGLNAYHALIVLNLSWMLNSSALIICILPAIEGQIGKSWSERAQRLWPYKAGQIWAFCLVSLHLCAMACLGIWFWAKISVFGNQPQCTQETFTSIFTYQVPVTNSSLHIFSLVIYSIAVIPGINAIIFTLFSVCLVSIIVRFTWRMRSRPYNFRHLYCAIVAAQVLTSILFIVDTELIIHRSRGLVASGESLWSFGQTLALVLVIGPILEVVDVLKPKARKIRWVKRAIDLVEWWFRRRLRTSEKSWKDFYEQAIGEISHVMDFVDHLANNSNPRSNALTTVKHTLAASKSALTAANNIINGPEYLHAEKIHIHNLHHAARKVTVLREDLADAHRLRFPEISDLSCFFAFNASLGTAKTSLDVAKAALETATTD